MTSGHQSTTYDDRNTTETRFDEDELLAAYAEAQSCHGAAEILGAPYSSVREAAIEAGLHTPRAQTEISLAARLEAADPDDVRRMESDA